jgi:aminoglycoside 6'-N-acetyltransferase I
VAAMGIHSMFVGTDDELGQTSLGGVDLYPDVLARLAALQNLRDHPVGFYQRLGYSVIGVMPDANGFGKPDILLARRLIAPA